MAHRSEIVHLLSTEEKRLTCVDDLKDLSLKSGDLVFVCLPFFPDKALVQQDVTNLGVAKLAEMMPKCSVLSILCVPDFAAELCKTLSVSLRYQLWIAVKLEVPVEKEGILPMHHAALLVFTKDDAPLRHTYTRIGYSYCPACNRTTKDYGGKKHTYHQYGTLMSDVWRDIVIDPHGNLGDLTSRIRDLFSLPPHERLLTVDLRELDTIPRLPSSNARVTGDEFQTEESVQRESRILTGDSLAVMKTMPDESVDFCFADPPYNLGKKYNSWNDNLQIEEYFAWCDQWLHEMVRVLKPGRTLTVLNIPLWAARHFRYLKVIAEFQNWITWEGLSLPVRKIMPAHYSILCFSKGKPRALPGSNGQKTPREQAALECSTEFFCHRASCKKKRHGIFKDVQRCTDLWWDIFRLKHNSRRVDHPCQLPPMLMQRLISLYTYTGEHVLDPFNGAGTTTLAAEYLGRSFTGIEIDLTYSKLAIERHKELRSGIDPFRKRSDTPNAKNSRVKRIKKQRYEVPKKTLQLEVRRIADSLGHMPSKEEIRQFSQYAFKYYEDYFIDWGEVYAAARTTGMTEYRQSMNSQRSNRDLQLSLLESNDDLRSS